MMRGRSQTLHWASMNEFGFIAGMRLLFWISKVLGRWPFRLILYPVLMWYVLTKSTARVASQIYLIQVNQVRPIGTSLINVMHHFAAFAEMILDKMMLWSGLFDTSMVRYFGSEEMRELIEQKRGAVLICSHFGNIDLCRVLSKRHCDLKLTILVHTKHAREFNRMLEMINPVSQMNLLQVTDITPATAMMLSERVAAGEFVVIAGDRIPVSGKPRVVMAKFLGKPAPFPVGPYILASVLQCPAFMIFSLRRHKHYEIHFTKLRESIRLPRKGRDHALAELVADYATELERHCVSEPLQWFNFYDYWHLPDWTHSDAAPHHYR